jgi:hypothetical protein
MQGAIIALPENPHNRSHFDAVQVRTKDAMG